MKAFFKPWINFLFKTKGKESYSFRFTLLDFCLLLMLFSFVPACIFLKVPEKSQEQEIAGFTTSLAGRTKGQLHNIRLAVKRLDGEIIPSGEIFSFNRRVGPFSPDKGYVKGWAILDGELVPQYGGGVCQVSSTLYNCALLANFKILERSRHLWPVRSVPPGLDAAVASGGIDLKFQNTLLTPVRIRAQVVGQRLNIRFLSSSSPPYHVQIFREVLATFPPTVVYQSFPQSSQETYQVINKGLYGCRVRVYRVFYRKGTEVGREIISQDYYAPRSRVLRVGEGKQDSELPSISFGDKRF